MVGLRQSPSECIRNGAKVCCARCNLIMVAVEILEEGLLDGIINELRTFRRIGKYLRTSLLALDFVDGY